MTQMDLVKLPPSQTPHILYTLDLMPEPPERLYLLIPLSLRSPPLLQITLHLGQIQHLLPEPIHLPPLLKYQIIHPHLILVHHIITITSHIN